MAESAWTTEGSLPVKSTELSGFHLLPINAFKKIVAIERQWDIVRKAAKNRTRHTCENEKQIDQNSSPHNCHHLVLKDVVMIDRSKPIPL